MSDHRGRVAVITAYDHRPPVRRLAAFGVAAADMLFAALIVGAGIIGLSPCSAVAAARETLAARRQERAGLAGLDAVWARQARRNRALPGRPPLPLRVEP